MNIAIILAGGIGKRLGLDKPKQLLKIAGKTVLEHTVNVFQDHNQIDEIAIVINGNHYGDIEKMVLDNHWTKVKKVLCGGNERYDSSLAAIKAYEKHEKIDEINLIFHDAVRPMVSKRIISETIKALEYWPAVDVAIKAVDTIIEVNDSTNIITHIPDRTKLRRGQTPQGFKYSIIRDAYEIALLDPNMHATDDCGIVKKYLPDTEIHLVEGEEQNLKLTYPEDIYVLDKLFQIRSTQPDNRSFSELEDKIIVVFGGNSGIGQSIMSLALEYGANCYAFSRSLTKTDIKNKDDVEIALNMVHKQHGRIDYIINCAAVLNKEPIMHLSTEKIDEIIDINYKGMVNVSVAAYDYLKESSGQLLHFTSSSYTRGRANYALYSSTKAAVVNFVQAVAEEWKTDGIRVNCINPQRTKTPMRISNFGLEPEGSLLSANSVAEISLKTLLSDFSGEVVDVKLT